MVGAGRLSAVTAFATVLMLGPLQVPPSAGVATADRLDREAVARRGRLWKRRARGERKASLPTRSIAASSSGRIRVVTARICGSAGGQERDRERRSDEELSRSSVGALFLGKQELRRKIAPLPTG